MNITMTRSGYTAENDERLAAYLHALSDGDIRELQLSILHNLNVNESTRAALVHQAAMLRKEVVARNRQAEADYSKMREDGDS